MQDAVDQDQTNHKLSSLANVYSTCLVAGQPIQFIIYVGAKYLSWMRQPIIDGSKAIIGEHIYPTDMYGGTPIQVQGTSLPLR